MTRDSDSRPDEQPGPADDGDSTWWTLVARYLAGEATAKEVAAVEWWAAADPDRQAELDLLRHLWGTAAALPSAARVDAMWRDLSAQMRASAEQEGGSATPGRSTPAARPRVSRRVPRFVVHPGSRRSWRRSAGALAAGLVLVAGAALARRELATRPAAPALAAQPPREIVTARGQRATITLVDGTQVTLGPESRLRIYPFPAGPATPLAGRASVAGSPPSRREVELAGEAVFEVVHDPRRPFLVRSGNAITEDLGTTFGVRAYPGDTLVRIVVAEGQVALRPAGSPAGTGTLLGAGDVGRLDRHGRAAVARGVDPDRYLAWTRGRVVFQNAPLGEVADELGRWFNVTVVVARASDARRRITVDMPVRPLTEVLDAITVPLRLRHRQAGDTVVLQPRAAR